MSRKNIVVGHEELGRFIRDALIAKGASADDAASVADGLVWANLRGVDGHGVSRLPFYLKMIERGEINVKARPQLADDRAATFVLDGGHGFGPAAMMQAIGIADGARANGWRRVSAWCARPRIPARSAATPNGWRSAAAPPSSWSPVPAFVAYHGARVASLGTSPIAIAVPSGGGPIVLDMATSTISNGTILQARAVGAAVAGGHRADGAGRADHRSKPGGNPAAARRSKGIGARPDVRDAGERARRGADPGARPRPRKAQAPHAEIAPFSPSMSTAFRPLADFAHDADTLAAILKALPRQAGFDEILLPGERGGRSEAARRKSGIPLPAKLWEELEAIARADAIKLPALLSSPD